MNSDTVAISNQQSAISNQGVFRLLNISITKTEYITIQGMSLNGHAFFVV